MSIIIFILILGLLIFVHELGHFLVAKKSGIRVDEFAIGFPPRIFSFVKNGTRYALNMIPFGGYVKIYGENPDDGASDKNAHDSMLNKPKSVQALVLVAGVVFNMLLAFLLMWILFIRGVDFPEQLVPFVDQTSDGVRVEYVLEDSVAQMAGLQINDIILSVTTPEHSTVTDPINITSVLYSDTKEITDLVLLRNKDIIEITLIPIDSETRFGFSLTDRVYIKDNPFVAVYHSYIMTGHLTKLTTIGLFEFFGKLFTGRANFEEVAGPVGIVSLVDKAADNGLNDVLFLTAIISINLAILNLLPIPALDGGRLVVVGIEAIRRKDLDHTKVSIVNLVGFLLLIGLMILLTFHDIRNLF